MTLYDKNVEDLTEAEVELWTEAFKSLSAGDRLYGENSDDVSHVGWAIQMAVAQLIKYFENLSPEDQEEQAGTMLLELGLSKDGLFIAVIPDTA